jgi:dolichol-phosphate mannosyltransferase
VNTDDGADPARGIPRAAVVVVLIASLIQLVVGALGPLDGDETLYWEWARHLAWGYFDHPPGVALLVRLGVALFGVSALGVRCMAVLANLGGALIVITLARRHGGDRAALRAALIISCLPILTNWLMFATPDTALFLTAMGVLLLVDNALRQPRGSVASLRWWLLAGVVLGLAALAKELAILLPMGIVLACLTHQELRPRLAEPGPYLAGLATAIVIVPLVLWNRDHGWVLLQFAMQRGLGAEPGSAVGRELEYLGGQAAVVSPLLFVLLAIAVFGTLRGRSDPRQYFLAVSALTTFGWFAIAALRHPMEPNWVLMAYPPAAILLAAGPASRVSRRWLNASLALGGGIVVLLYLHTAVRILPLSPLDDPIRRGHGWQEVAGRVDAVRRDVGPPATWIAANRFQDASQLAFHLDGHPFVFSLNIQGRANQYDLWPGFAQQAKPGDRLILVLDDATEAPIARDLTVYFDRISVGARVVAGGAQPTLVPKRIWVLEGWHGGWRSPRR